MVATSTGEQLQSGTIISEVDICRLILKPACLPILVGVMRFNQHTAANPEETVKIASFISKSQRFAEIDLYWTQATKVFAGGKPSTTKSSVSFDSARASDRFWIAYGELSSHCLKQPDKLTTIFSNRSYLGVLNHLLPILISCFSIDDLPLLLKLLVSSSLAVEHISNVAMNLPSICGHIAVVMQNLLRDAQEPAIIWRCSRVFLKISSCDIHLAMIVRSSFVKVREHPLLCVEITSRYIMDTEKFIDDQLCSNSNCESISSSWLLSGLRDSDLLAISQSAVDRLGVLLNTDISDIASNQVQWEFSVCQCIRIVATCNLVVGSISFNSSCSSYQGKAEVAKSAVKVLIKAAETALENLLDGSLLIRCSEDFIEYTLRLAIILLVVNFACLAANGRRNQVDISAQDRGTQQIEKAALASLLTSAMSALTHFTERDTCTQSGRAPEAARCFSLCFRLAVTFRSHFALRNLCAVELSLDHFHDFLSEEASDLPLLASTMAQIISPPSRLEQRDRTNAFCNEFEALHQPPVICGSTERAGDWVYCLSLMFSSDLMISYRYRNRGQAGSSSAEEVKILQSETNGDDFSDGSAGSTHTLMISVLKSARWPPHSLLQTCIDRWLIRCVGVGMRIGSCSDRASSIEKDCPRLGLPVLQNEATDLTQALLCRSQSHGSLPPLFSDPLRGSFPPPFSDPLRGSFPPPLFDPLRGSLPSPLSDPLRDPKQIQRSRGRNTNTNMIRNSKGNIDIPFPVDPDNPYATFLRQCKYTVNINTFDFEANSHRHEADHAVSPAVTSDDEIDLASDEMECSTDMGWVGVIACYSALHYASISMYLDNTVSTDPGHSCDVTYNGPYVCDFRLLPVKRAVEFLLSKCLESSAVEAAIDKSMTISGRKESRVVNSYHEIFTRLIDAISELCPELLMADRCDCFNFESIVTSTVASSYLDDDASPRDDQKDQENQEEQKENLFASSVIGLLSKKGVESNTYIPLHKLVAEIISSTPITTSNLSTDSVLRQLLEGILSLAFEAPSSKQRCAGLWAVWRALHDCYACPQQLELLTLIVLVHRDQVGSSPKLFTSYEQLIQEPLMLFNLPLRILSNLFALRLVIFITRGALTASAGSVKRALAIKHKVAQNFLAASMQHRSTTEASLYLHKDTFLHLQDVMAIRLIIHLWEELIDQSADIAVETRLVLNDFILALFEESLTLSALLLCHQLTPQGIELLLSCAPSVALMVCEVHLAAVQSSIAAFESLMTVAALEIDPTLTSTSVIFTTSANAASLLATQCEVPPEDVERLLMHSLCILRLTSMQHRGISATLESLHVAVRQIARAMPNFLLFATNSLNAHLVKEDVRVIEQLSAAVLHILFESYPKYAAKMHNFAHNAESVVTTNTAVIGLVVKSWGSKGHPKAEETITMKTRPAIKALRRIVKKADQRYRKNNIADQPAHDLTLDPAKRPQGIVPALDSEAVQVAGKSCRAEHMDVTVEDTSIRKKPKNGPSLNSSASGSARIQ